MYWEETRHPITWGGRDDGPGLQTDPRLPERGSPQLLGSVSQSMQEKVPRPNAQVVV